MDNLVADEAAASEAVCGDTQVPSYYTRKTADILHKYGPGPRIHFHVGIFEPGITPDTTVSQKVIRDRLRASQEAVLDDAARSWGFPKDLPARLFDIGCGPGGGSIYWATRSGRRTGHPRPRRHPRPARGTHLRRSRGHRELRLHGPRTALHCRGQSS
ncbi:hypothetical protein ACIHFE_28400 [Streptomyces sp. NPDC052396]|uniref:hypothetical protein n=1 Tax=Streptomyces sp. NPDC052396 TaxID=3365689 RepID=UPI0037D43B6D